MTAPALRRPRAAIEASWKGGQAASAMNAARQKKSHEALPPRKPTSAALAEAD
jgi:hypothetical protein